MDWAAKVDIYCERLDPSFWAEPLNALSNLAFLVAAFIAFRAARRAGRLELLTLVMILLAVAVGVGSFLFHTFATRWAGVADTMPILLFILFYLYLAARRYLRLPVMAALVVPVAFVPFAALFTNLWRGALPSLNGSEGYLPVVVALLLFGAILHFRGHPAAPALIQAAAVFALSLTFRSLDQSVCGAIPIGVHFLWHCLNGLLLALVMLAFIRHGAPRPARLAPRSDGG
ncbi:hypothetical protein G5B40_06880 [Pikeienuella piscinae]|uniref:Ceramidase n=1 Tax=Pikeienuella piscinae TaxID=2748098 RepID=A0A7L5BWH6_9RHOB|nr:ceramidase domain-containing protein [Pikeienuella piscinae]QIE55198.1 hypothetical protein G5B40_06880 [Pikeienuella piscinae]